MSVFSKVKSITASVLLIHLQAFSYLQSTEKLAKFFHSIVQNVQVFARVAPKQKVLSITCYILNNIVIKSVNKSVSVMETYV